MRLPLREGCEEFRGGELGVFLEDGGGSKGGSLHLKLCQRIESASFPGSPKLFQHLAVSALSTKATGLPCLDKRPLTLAYQFKRGSVDRILRSWLDIHPVAKLRMNGGGCVLEHPSSDGPVAGTCCPP